jgi:methylglutamate dehydrogenase subunit B
MFLRCPFCGERELSEFVCKGQALPKRPDPVSEHADVQFHDYYYSRANPAGPVWEHWFHEAGCANWLAVYRDTRTHEILRVDYVRQLPP